jgi:ABC-type multidrug transport system permease subunit
VQITVGAFVSMTTFFRTRLHQETVGDGVLYVNALFFAIIIFFFTGFGELAGTIKRLPVLIKHRDMLLSPAWAYTVSTMILSLPSSLIEVGIYSSLTYFVTGYAPDAGRFFKYFLVLFMIQQQAGGMFRFIAGLCRTDTLAFTLGWIMILLFFMLGGFIIPRPDIPVWWRWAYWVTNMAYAEEATSVNELTAPRWRKVSFILLCVISLSL